MSVATNFADNSTSSATHFKTKMVTSPFVTPALLRDFYSLSRDDVGSNMSLSTQSVAEFISQYYSPSDLQEYLSLAGLPNVDAELVGPNNASFPGDEATLDVEVILATGNIKL